MRFRDILMAAAASGSGAPSDADATLWAAQVVTNGGTVSTDRLNKVAGLIIALKAGGSWALDDDIWLLAAENATQALTSLKQRRLATVTAAPTFTADRDYTFDGATNFIDTLFIPNTHKVAMTQDNVRSGIYVRNNVTAAGYSVGVIDSGQRSLRMRPRTGTTVSSADTNCASPVFTLSAADTRGFYTSSRSAATAAATLAFKNAAALTRTSDPTVFATTGLPIHSIMIGALNNAGTAASFAAHAVGLVVVGAALSQAQETAEYNAIQAHMTALGAQV